MEAAEAQSEYLKTVLNQYYIHLNRGLLFSVLINIYILLFLNEKMDLIFCKMYY